MSSGFFGQYLLAKGIIDRDALLDALERQRRSNLSLSELAVRQNLLDRSQADTVMARYRMSDKSIETILVEGGFLEAGQVERLQRIQRSSWLRIGAALVEGGHLTEEAIAKNLGEYRSLESAADEQIRSAMHDLPEPEAVGSCVELTVFHFARVTGRPAKLEKVELTTGATSEGVQRFSQRIVGDRDLTIAVDLPPVLAAAVARGMLGFEIEAGSETEADAVCEFINLIGGNACTRIEQFGILLRPEPPVWSVGAGVVSPCTRVVRARVASGDTEFVIGVFVCSEGAS
jgi:CheY-specific phosphatase CheX